MGCCFVCLWLQSAFKDGEWLWIGAGGPIHFKGAKSRARAAAVAQSNFYFHSNQSLWSQINKAAAQRARSQREREWDGEKKKREKKHSPRIWNNDLLCGMSAFPGSAKVSASGVNVSRGSQSAYAVLYFCVREQADAHVWIFMPGHKLIKRSVCEIGPPGAIIAPPSAHTASAGDFNIHGCWFIFAHVARH